MPHQDEEVGGREPAVCKSPDTEDEGIVVILSQVKLGQVRLGKNRLGLFWIGKVTLGKVRLGQVRLCSFWLVLVEEKPS